MKKYWELFKSQIKIDLHYKAWFWANMISKVMQLLIIYAFWNAVFANQGEIASVSQQQMVTYVVIAMFLGTYVYGTGVQLANSVRDGSIATELMKPYDLLLKLVSLNMGNKVMKTFREVLPLVLLAMFFLSVQGPPSLAAGILFLVSAVFGILIGVHLELVVGLIAFWTVNIWGARMLVNTTLLFFSGALMPLYLFPDWLQTASFYLPFQSIVHVPVSIYTGTITGPDILYAVLLQIVWLGIVCTVIRMFWSLALRRVTIFGG
ncbi:ABC transporter permease [Marinicrinis sediminis]|uniref:ABC transporter permease n=1 Tax=Marinicrinis sediminis TaxID=1652465 RepID=A0ABW5R8N8_9BACL